jgi:hypothetical protein
MPDNFNAASPALTASFSLARRLTAAQVRAWGAVQTMTFDIATLPPNAVVKRAMLLFRGQAAGVTTLLLSLGFDGGSSYQEYFNQHDIIADAAGAVVGNSPSISSEAVPCAAIPSITTSTEVKAILTCSTGAETFATVTGLDLSIYFECVVLPS